MWARHNRWAENNFKTQWFEQSPAVQHLTHTMYMDDSRLPQGCYKWLNFNYTHTISSATGSASWLVTVDTHTTSALDNCWTEGLDWLNMDWCIPALICVHFTLHGVTHPSLAMWLSWCHSATCHIRVWAEAHQERLSQLLPGGGDDHSSPLAFVPRGSPFSYCKLGGGGWLVPISTHQ